MLRVIIAGAGEAGIAVAAHLRAGGHAVTVIDRDETAARRAFERHGLVALTGDATSARLLRDADVARADVVVAMLRRDADNLAAALLAQAAGVRRVMVRMRDTEYRGVYAAAGVQRILSETDVLIGALATAIEHEAVRHSMILGNGESMAIELVVPKGSRTVGRTIADLAVDPAFPRSCVFAAMSDGGPMEAPRGASVVHAEMALVIVVRRSDMGEAIEFFMQRS
ncbi:Trk system potassium uptake protein TrkA [Minicystis rosea]|nr:Trk system potassium uptake protein TrkA [Minicystis rosea]